MRASGHAAAGHHPASLWSDERAERSLAAFARDAPRLQGLFLAGGWADIRWYGRCSRRLGTRHRGKMQRLRTDRADPDWRRLGKRRLHRFDWDAHRDVGPGPAVGMRTDDWEGHERQESCRSTQAKKETRPKHRRHLRRSLTGVRTTRIRPLGSLTVSRSLREVFYAWSRRSRRWQLAVPLRGSRCAKATFSNFRQSRRSAEPGHSPTVSRSPGHLVLPAFPLCIGRNLIDGSDFVRPVFSARLGQIFAERASLARGVFRLFGTRCTERDDTSRPDRSGRLVRICLRGRKRSTRSWLRVGARSAGRTGPG